jgi:predicted DNA-binding protein (MmcQ/YjbR family)
MNIDRLREICLAFPAATEQIQWDADLVFKIGGKMFAVAATDPGAAHRLSFKCSDEGFAELTEQEGIVPAPYLARARWVAPERFDALSDREITERIAEAYQIVLSKLPKKQQADVAAEAGRRQRR